MRNVGINPRHVPFTLLGVPAPRRDAADPPDPLGPACSCPALPRELLAARESALATCARSGEAPLAVAPDVSTDRLADELRARVDEWRAVLAALEAAAFFRLNAS